MSEDSDWSNRILQIVAYVSFGIVLVVLWYAALSSLTEDLTTVGANLVNVEFPPPSIFPVYLKPITWLYVGSLGLLYSEMELNKERMKMLSPGSKTLVKLAAFLVAVVFFYEICYNFVLWGGEIAAAVVFGNLNPDTLVNKFPDLKEPWNLVFATKLWTVFFIAGVYVFWFFSRLENVKPVGGGGTAPPAQAAGAGAGLLGPRPSSTRGLSEWASWSAGLRRSY